MDKLFSKLVISAGASLAVTENVSLEPLWTALITLAVSLITVFSVEGVAWLKAWLTKKRKQEEADYKDKCEEADEIVQIAEHENKNKED